MKAELERWWQYTNYLSEMNQRPPIFNGAILTKGEYMPKIENEKGDCAMKRCFVWALLCIAGLLMLGCVSNGTIPQGTPDIVFADKPEATIFVDPTTEQENPRHAPNMYIDWITNHIYDAISVDWYCEMDAPNTYWAVHNWDGGYAGFQNLEEKHIVIMSLWNLPNGISPTIEYALSGRSGDFGGEGTGKQVITDYEWEEDKWCSMCIEMKIESNKTVYTQYVKEENGDWVKTAAISYPIVRDAFVGSSVFQEDFGFNNLMRSCRLDNAGGRIQHSGLWETWNNCTISNSYFPTETATWEYGVEENVNFDCGWGESGYVWIRAGGEGFERKMLEIPAMCVRD